MAWKARRRYDLIVIIGSLQVGGTERHLSYVLPELRRKGLRILLYILSQDGPLRRVFEEGGVDLLFRERWLKFAQKYFPPKTKSLAYLCFRLSDLVVLLLQNRSAILHCFLPQSIVLGGSAATLTGHRFRLFSRRSLNHYQKKHRFYGAIERWAMRGATLLLANSEAVRQDLLQEGYPPGRIRLIYNGIPDLESARNRGDGKPSQFTMTLVANLIPYKGHLDLFEALSEIASALPQGWRLLCVGSGPEYQRVLEAKCEALGILSHVEFLGERTDIGQIYAATDLGLLVSHEEGFSNSILEGMSCRVPFIVTRVGGNPEAILHEKNGLVVPPGDAKSLGDAILRLAHSPDLPNAYGQAGRDLFERRFSLDRCVDSYLQIYEGILQSKRSIDLSHRPATGP